MITINKVANNGENLPICMKGALEFVMDRCTSMLINERVKPFDDNVRNILNDQLASMMEASERCLGSARMDLDPAQYPQDSSFETEEIHFAMDEMIFIGFMALLDPSLEAVPEAVATCQTAGVKVIMVTGDHPARADSIVDLEAHDEGPKLSQDTNTAGRFVDSKSELKRGSRCRWSGRGHGRQSPCLEKCSVSLALPLPCGSNQ